MEPRHGLEQRGELVAAAFIEKRRKRVEGVGRDLLECVGGRSKLPLSKTRSSLALRKTAISTELSPRLPAVRGDRVHLQQVLLNLTMNALEAMASQAPEKRRLSVRTSLNGEGTAEVAVTDSGHGIEPDKLARLFEPFFTTKPNGMGMGLSIARRIVEAHRGRISAENNASGGATFRLLLPVTTVESES